MRWTKASGMRREQLRANGQRYNDILKSTKASLIDLIRIADERFVLVERPWKTDLVLCRPQVGPRSTGQKTAWGLYYKGGRLRPLTSYQV